MKARFLQVTWSGTILTLSKTVENDEFHREITKIYNAKGRAKRSPDPTLCLLEDERFNTKKKWEGQTT